MTLWAILTIMIAVAAVCLAAPFLRRLDHPKECPAADRVRPPLLSRLSPDKRDFVAVATAGVILLGSVGLYALNGSADLGSASVKNSSLGLSGASAVDVLAAATFAPGAGRLPENPLQAPLGTVDEMIARLIERLNRDPNDSEGWRMLGWSYFNTDRFAQSAAAYAKAIELDPENADLRSSRGEALVRAADGHVTDEARAVFEQVLWLEAQEPRARFFIGLAKEQAGNKLAALDDWVAILNETDSRDAWVDDLVQRVTELGQETGIDVSARLSRHARTGHGDVLGQRQERGLMR